jgi:hypothetical protein
VAAATAALKKRECDERDDEIARLNGKVVEITMENELLRQHSLAGRPSWPQDISSGQGRPAGHRAGLHERRGRCLITFVQYIVVMTELRLDSHEQLVV